jgi:hypothetical protein
VCHCVHRLGGVYFTGWPSIINCLQEFLAARGLGLAWCRADFAGDAAASLY